MSPRIGDRTLDALSRRLTAEDNRLARELAAIGPGKRYDAIVARRSGIRADQARISAERGIDVRMQDTREPVRAVADLMGQEWAAGEIEDVA